MALRQTARVLPKNALSQAIKYCRNQWDHLEAFMKDGRIEIDNNRGERLIKPFVIGRKKTGYLAIPLKELKLVPLSIVL